MMELNDTIAVICVILAVVLAIYSTPVRNMLLEAVGPMGDLVLFIIEAGLLAIVIITAIRGQNVSRV
jgi:hypothetical protein